MYICLTNLCLCNFLGLVPSSVVLTAFQVASRLFVTWAIAHSVPQVSGVVCGRVRGEVKG